MATDEIEAPQPKSTEDVSAQAIQAQIAALPQIYAAQSNFGPQFTQLELNNLRRFAPEFTQEQLNLQNRFGQEFAKSTLDVASILSPESIEAQNRLKEYFQAGAPSLTPEQQRKSINAVTDAAAFRGLAESGFTAEAALKNLIFEEQQLKDNFYNKALASSGKIPTSITNTINPLPQSFGPGQLVSNVNPSQIFGYQSGVDNLNAEIYRAELQNPKVNPYGEIFGTIAGAAAGSAVGPQGAMVGASLGKQVSQKFPRGFEGQIR